MKLTPLQWPALDSGQHYAEGLSEATCLHCGRTLKMPTSLRRSSSRTGQYGMGYTARTALKGLRRAIRSNHLRHCTGRLPGDWT